MNKVVYNTFRHISNFQLRWLDHIFEDTALPFSAPSVADARVTLPPRIPLPRVKGSVVTYQLARGTAAGSVWSPGF